MAKKLNKKTTKAVFARNLKAHRAKLGISQAAAAEKIGVARSTYIRWEQEGDDNAPAMKMFATIAEAMGLSLIHI